MTELLERVIAQLKTLPDDEQDAIAARLLAELEDERVASKKHFARNLMGFLHQFKSKLPKLMSFGAQILTTIVFSSEANGLPVQSQAIVATSLVGSPGLLR